MAMLCKSDPSKRADCSSSLLDKRRRRASDCIGSGFREQTGASVEFDVCICLNHVSGGADGKHAPGKRPSPVQ